MITSRPTREKVDADLARVADPNTCTDDLHRRLAAQVHSLRVDLDTARVASQQIAEWHAEERAKLQRLRDDLGMEMGMRAAAIDQLETLRRRLWALLGASQLSDDDTVERLASALRPERHQ